MSALRWLVLATLLVAGSAPGEPSVGPDRLKVLSYNVHGFWMPEAKLGSEERSTAIGELLGDYDVVLLQEDFAYHDLLVGAFDFATDEQGNPPRAHWALSSLQLLTAPARLFSSRLSFPNGSGLSILSRRLEAVPGSVAREYLGACHGWIGYANDCLASKGFLRVRIRMRSGVELDVYTTHLDAGRAEGDREARSIQLARLAERIEALSGNGALLLAGDFNVLHADIPGDPDSIGERARLDAFMQRLRLEDAAAAVARPENGWEEQLDYILYRSSDRVGIRVLRSGEDERFVREGAPLSDHPAIFAELEIRDEPR